MDKAKCGKCEQPVYFAESVLAFGKRFHKKCFICSNAECSRNLDSRTSSEHKGKPYCNHCHRSLFGIQGVGYGIGSGVLTTANPISDGNKIIYGEDKTNHVTASISYGVKGNGVYKTTYVEKVEPTKLVEKRTIAQEFYTPNRYEDVQSDSEEKDIDEIVSKMRNQRTEESYRPSKPFTLPNIPRQAICPKCSKAVYEAEKILAAGGQWHKTTCFICETCSKRLESRTLCENAGKLYCKHCYAVNFGPKGYMKNSVVVLPVKN
ncbi:hypothetical protein WR25_12589 [Diploscapter pachys]|uniref:Cysteine-rich protein 1 n=1 Tax=Diploscapter pachys TaxID=2018661 RepID=A0A2A2KNX1_9BILA|nr:hypothetical protein WR25_12589 [Diploscapter pachys]